MRIAQLAPPLERVPPAGYGGTERVIHTLTEELVRRGQEVTLFASGDSETSARLVPTFDEAIWHHRPAYADVVPSWTVVLGKVQRQLEEFDVVHSHLEYFGLPLARQSDVPVITTLHGRLDLPELRPVFAEFANAPLISISHAQRRPVAWANFIATIYHGIDLTQLTFNPRPDGYLAFLGRISREKGVDKAIRIARRLGLPLKVAARMPLPHVQDARVRADWDYWNREVEPLLGSDVEILGEVAGPEKDEFLRNASALLFPITWPEPFGLVMVEALACGTPVLALRRGSVPELIEDGCSGFIRDTEEELVDAAQHLGEIDRFQCRREAERRFSPAAMANAYELVYDSLVNSRSARRVFALNGHVRPDSDASVTRVLASIRNR
jgi:glycosyltransferase involved in cell wall biosynthesis